MTAWLTSRPPDRVADDSLLLRRWRMEDAAPLRSLVAANVDHLSPWMPWAVETAAGRDPGFPQRTVEQFELGTDFAYLILDPREHAIMGACGLHARIGPNALELGYWIAAPHSGRGHATAAAVALTRTAFSLPEVARVEIHCDQANTASARVAERAGFRWAGEDRPTSKALYELRPGGR